LIRHLFNSRNKINLKKKKYILFAFKKWLKKKKKKKKYMSNLTYDN
jgi:hypothetical protein